MPRRRLRASIRTAQVALVVAGSGLIAGLAAELPGGLSSVAYAAAEPVPAEQAPADVPPSTDPPPSADSPPPASEPAAPAPADPAPAPVDPPPPAAPAPQPLPSAAHQFDTGVGELPDVPSRAHEAPVARPRAPQARTEGPDRDAPAPAPESLKTPARHGPADPARTDRLPTLPPTRVPNFFIDSFQIPPFLLSIYQAAGIQYGVRWEVLAAINEIESDYGRNLNVSSAGALGWMQFMPSTWAQYGTDANRDGREDPYNPVDAIFAAARYLKAAGAGTSLRKAIFAYNHAGWYVESVLERARRIGGMPDDLVNALTGLSRGHLPVAARAHYGSTRPRHGARRGVAIHAAAGSPAVAVQDGEIVRVGNTTRLGRFVMLRDVYGNTYTYGGLHTVAAQVPVPKERTQSTASIARQLALPEPDLAPTEPASAGSNRAPGPIAAGTARQQAQAPAAEPATTADPAGVLKERLFAHPGRPRSLHAGGELQMLESWTPLPVNAELRSYLTGSSALRREDVVLKRLVRGRHVVAGTILGRVGTSLASAPAHMRFEIRPAGRGAPRIDPLPIVRGWRLLDATAIHGVEGWNTGVGDGAQPTPGEIVLMSKEALTQHVLANPAIEIYACGRRDIEAGIVDRRVLATLAFLAASGLAPTVTSLQCGHGLHTAGGNISAHASGNAVDIAKINGTPILGNQRAGSIADTTIRRLLSLQGALAPAQIISLMSYEGAPSTLALSDHADHIHIGFDAQLDLTSSTDGAVPGTLRPSQWTKLIGRLGAIANPTVRLTPSDHALRVKIPPPPVSVPAPHP